MSENELLDNIKLAFELQNNGQYREAIAVLYKVLAIEPDNIEALLQIAYLFYARHDLDVASEYYEKVLIQDKDNITALEGCLNILKAKHCYEEALGLSKKLLELSRDINSFIQYLHLLCLCKMYKELIQEFNNSEYKDDDVELLCFYVGLAYFYTGEDWRAGIYLEKVINKNEKNTEAIFHLAKLEFDRQNYDKADLLISKIIGLKECAKTYNLKGLILIQLAKYQEAIENFIYATKISPDVSEYFYNLAITYSMCGWKQEAERNFIEAIKLEPENLHYQYTLAYLYYEEKLYPRAKDILSEILKMSADMQDALILKALIMVEEGNSPEAALLFDKISCEESEDDFLYYAKGRTYRQLQYFDKSIEAFEKAIDLKPESLEYKIQLAETYLEKEDFDKSQSVIEKILENSPEYVYAHIVNAKLLLAKERYEEALVEVNVALKLDNNAHDVYFLKAQILVKINEFDEALSAMKNAITLSPECFEYYEFVGKIYALTENYSSALLYYQEILENTKPTPTLILETAKCAENLNNIIYASSYYFKAYALQPKSQELAVEYAKFLFRIHKYKNALRFLNNVIKNEKDVVDVSSLQLLREEIETEYLLNSTFIEKFLYKLFRC